jgi:predicted metal-dependent HD superfamily phosphohydrolase
MNLENLNQRWETLLLKFGVEQQTAQNLFLDLSTFYSSPERRYHTLTHIQHFLSVVDTLTAKAENLEAIELAAWFHDLIYNSKAKDNEEKSADYAESILKSLAIPIEVIDKVKRLILITKSHQITEEDDIDTKIMLDADLAILGVDDTQYVRYAQAIRQEYAWVMDQDYRKGRTQFLQSLLQRPRIYQTEEIFEALETKARNNLRKEIDAMSHLNEEEK